VTASSAQENAKTRHRVLLVDDDRRILNFLRLKLMHSGYEVMTAMTGQGALSAVEPQKPDIMVLDVMLPGKDGLQVLRELRGSSDLAVIVMSARTDCAAEAMSLGAHGFIPKPFDPDEMVESISAVLKQRSTGADSPS